MLPPRILAVIAGCPPETRQKSYFNASFTIGPVTSELKELAFPALPALRAVCRSAMLMHTYICLVGH